MRRDRPGLPGPFGTEEQEDPGSDPEEDVAPWLFADLFQGHHITVELFCPVNVGYIQDGFKDPGDSRRLICRSHVSLRFRDQ